ncbi:oligosaccharide flippase family protein [Psychrilyobacter atlanticus]|uniref:oligosaccharide flippase family protein n=1 Tax=Psychrilyobacter atlanticus TaxID=271091 RepID=UPI000410A466|nr:oligosaccharide flippase family protein [Psychrilyobacter atlanticus]
MNKVLKNSIMGMGTNMIYLITRLLITPIILSFISLEEFGLWSICFVIISYIGLTGSGIGNAYITYTAKFYANGNKEKINQLISSGTVFLSVTSIVLYSLVYFYIDLILSFFKIENLEFYNTAKVLILGSVIAFLIELTFEGFENFFEGIQEFVTTRTIWIATNFLEIFLSIIFLFNGFGVKSLLYAYLIKAIVKVSLHYIYMHKYIKPKFIFNFNILKEIFKFASKIQILSIIGIFMTTFNQLVVANILGLKQTGLFELGRKLPQKGASIAGGAFISFMPAAAEILKNNTTKNENHNNTDERRTKIYIKLVGLGIYIGALTVFFHLIYTEAYKFKNIRISGYSFILLSGVSLFFMASGFVGFRNYLLKGDSEHIENIKLKKLYLNGNRYISLLTFYLFVFLIFFAHEILYVWIGRNDWMITATMIIFSFSIMTNLNTGVGSSIMRGVNKPEYEIEYAVLNFVLAIFWIISFTLLFGIVGAAMGTALSTIVSSIYFILRINRNFKIEITEYYEKTLKYPLVIFLIGGVLSLLLSLFRVENRWIGLAVLGSKFLIYTVVIYLTLKYYFKLEEISRLERKIRKLLGKEKIYEGEKK